MVINKSMAESESGVDCLLCVATANQNSCVGLTCDRAGRLDLIALTVGGISAGVPETISLWMTAPRVHIEKAAGWERFMTGCHLLEHDSSASRGIVSPNEPPPGQRFIWVPRYDIGFQPGKPPAMPRHNSLRLLGVKPCGGASGPRWMPEGLIVRDLYLVTQGVKK
jgi:hypothetical protein